MNALDWLKERSVVVADTGNFDEIAQYAPRDATTNPSLILKAVAQPAYAPLLAAARGADLAEAADKLLVRFACEILQRVPGRVSTELDARMAFDSDASVRRARGLIQRFQAEGIPRERVLIKLAASWEGIQAARVLEREGIHCNLTLVFAMAQAQACAHAGVRLISPFVGRILDWHRQRGELAAGAADPGVASVLRILADYRRRGVATEVMGASFRSTSQILALAGCDLLTVSPDLLGALRALAAPSEAGLLNAAREAVAAPLPDSECAFRLALNEDAMATEKLAEGIRIFCRDAAQLDQLLRR